MFQILGSWPIYGHNADITTNWLDENNALEFKWLFVDVLEYRTGMIVTFTIGVVCEQELKHDIYDKLFLASFKLKTPWFSYILVNGVSAVCPFILAKDLAL